MKQSKGFTLVELLLVVAVIGILAVVVITQFPGVNTEARDTNRKQQVEAIQAALEWYALENRGFEGMTGTMANGCTDGDGWPNSLSGNPDFCQAVYYSNNNNLPVGFGHNSWSDLEGHLGSILPNVPVDPKNNYNDWQKYPAAFGVCNSGCDINSPITDGFTLVVVASINMDMDLCGTSLAMGYFIHTALEDETDDETLLNQGYSCVNVGELDHLKADWGIF